MQVSTSFRVSTMIIVIIYFVVWLTYKQVEVIFPGGTIVFMATSQYTEVEMDPVLLKQRHLTSNLRYTDM